MSTPPSKLDLLDGGRVRVSAEHATAVLHGIFRAIGCDEDIALSIAEHLADTSLCGMESHGLMRALQYAEQFSSGSMRANARPKVVVGDKRQHEIDGCGGIGIPAMALAYEHGMELARETGLSAVAIRNVGHTGRHGAFADDAAEQGFLTIQLGGGNRKNWRQVAPYGGARGVLPTNPYCIGIPGGERGPVVLDFATSKIAGGWVYAARSAGALLPEGCVIDKEGRPTRDPEDYFDGGAILPSGGHKGYALALMAELVSEALLGPVRVEGNWFLLTVDTRRWTEAAAMQSAAEDILSEMRNCPPAPGFDAVLVPGEREREQRIASDGQIAVPERTWQQILDLADRSAAATEV